ncbi:MAG TPA: hypothetical protein VFB02_21605 [Bradyrhizobium sp.]|nr:hypothetical protein [Bradyrhizobium sp.]
MANRTAMIASSIVAGVLAGAPLVMPRDVAYAAECRTEPGKDGTRSQHWHYRLEHGTNRHCWYLRGADEKAVQTAPSDESQASDAATQTDENAPRSVQDAHAEYPMRQLGPNTLAAPAPLATGPVPAQPQGDAQNSAVAARWPSPERVIAPAAALAVPAAPVMAVPAGPAMAAAAPTTTAPLTSSTAADATDSGSAADAPTDAPSDTSAPADTSVPAPLPAVAPAVPAKPSVSLQMLFAVIGGALALAGLTASVVYRLGRRKERRLATSERRAVLWEGVEPSPRTPWVPPQIEDEPAPAPIPSRKAAPNPPVQQQGPVQQQRYEKIEEILAQLVRHGQQSDA